MNTTPRGMRLHIGIFGRRNVGKSSLLNALVRQDVAIVSPEAGTTTDPVEKPMELLPLGPVVFVDTAGLDDEGSLGAERVRRTRQVADRTDLALLVAVEGAWGPYEEELLAEFQRRSVPVVVALNQADRAPDGAVAEALGARGVPAVRTSAVTGAGIGDLREALLAAAPESFLDAPTILGDLVPPGRVAVLVVPIDKEAPRGRIILPQVQAIRDLLDHDALSLVVKERELAAALALLREPPALVVTDSQAFQEVAALVPPEIPLTSFSIVFARLKGDLAAFARGAEAVARLRPGARVLVAEACTHHPIGDDIGRARIPAWLRGAVGGDLHFDTVQGRDFPEDLRGWDLVVHCGACMFTRRQVLTRQLRCQEAGVPMTNYGMVIAACHGILDRALEPFRG